MTQKQSILQAFHFFGGKITLEERFWNGVKKTENCWEWTKAKTLAGYGLIGYGKKLLYAHRLSYEIHIGSIPEKMFVLHRCDNPSCVNPKHLWIGTNHDNVKDM